MDPPAPDSALAMSPSSSAAWLASDLRVASNCLQSNKSYFAGSTLATRRPLNSIQPPRPEGHSTRDTHAQDIHPSLVEIEQMRIEQRREEILHHDQQSDPRNQTVAPKHQQMKPPHRIQHDDPDQAPLDRDIQRLVMGVPDDFRGSADLARGGLLKKPTCRSGTVSNDRRLGKEPQRLLPEFQPQTHRRRNVALFVALIIRQKGRGPRPEMRRCRPGDPC